MYYWGQLFPLSSLHPSIPPSLLSSLVLSSPSLPLPSLLPASPPPLPLLHATALILEQQSACGLCHWAELRGSLGPALQTPTWKRTHPPSLPPCLPGHVATLWDLLVLVLGPVCHVELWAMVKEGSGCVVLLLWEEWYISDNQGDLVWLTNLPLQVQVASDKSWESRTEYQVEPRRIECFDLL